MTLENRIKRSVGNRKKQDFFLTSDFYKMGSKSAVSAALKSLVEKGFLIRISLGIYAKTRWNRYAKACVAVMPIGILAFEALKRLGRDVVPGKAARDYSQGLITQIPNKNIYEIGRQRISRKFSLYGQTVYYEKNGSPVESRG